MVAAAPPGTTFVWQLGLTDIDQRLPGVAFRTVENAELDRHARECTMIISHAGVGSALLALKCGVRPILVPRQRAFGEHIDDHQVQVARDLEAKGLAIYADAGDLATPMCAYDYRAPAIDEPSRGNAGGRGD